MEFTRRAARSVRQFPPEFERAACSAIIQSVPHAVLLFDKTMRVSLANRAAAVLFHTTPSRLRGEAIVAVLPPDAIALVLRNLGAPRLKVIETTLTSKSRTPTTRTVKITAIRLTPSGFTLLLLEDISEKAMLEQQLIDTEKQVAMGQLAAGILHEVANPLTGLGSNLLFVRGALPATIDAGVAQALDASLDQLEQMRQLLGTLSGLRSRTIPRYETADLHDLIRQSVTFIARDAQQRHIVVALALAPEALSCEMDVRLIKQVLLNLFKNAMEAMPNGGRIDVRTAFRGGDQSAAESVVVEIADNGVGIPEADLRRVFRPLFSTKQRGIGLGLPFCRQAVEEHGGAIRLASPGKDRGAVAMVSLPARQPSQCDE